MNLPKNTQGYNTSKKGDKRRSLNHKNGKDNSSNKVYFIRIYIQYFFPNLKTKRVYLWVYFFVNKFSSEKGCVLK